MSKREVRDEIKQVEGDRTVKNKIFASMKNLSEASIAKKIAESDALIVGGDHIAVAIRYIKGSAAPFCTGKGIGRKAVNMIEIAKTHGVPALNSPALARKLYLEVQLDSFIPPEYYRDIAQILSESYSKGKTI